MNQSNLKRGWKRLLSFVLSLVMVFTAMTSMSIPVYAMEITVKVVKDNTSYSVDIEPSSTVEDIKSQLMEKTGISVEQQILKYNDKELKDDRTVADYNIQKGAILTLDIAGSAAHTHQWEYTLNNDGKTIKANCTNKDGDCEYKDRNDITCSIEAEDKIYSGKVYDGASVVNNITSVTGAKASDITYYSGSKKLLSAPIEAGTYTAKVTIDNQTASVDFTISKAELKPSVTIDSWVYGGTAATPELGADSNPGNGDVTYTYYTDKDCTTKTTIKDGAEADGAIPMNAGTYYVKASVVETENYAAGEATTSFVVKTKVITATVSAESKVYDGNTDAEVTAMVETGVEGESFTISGLKGTFADKNAGSGKVVTIDSSYANATAGANTVVTNYTVSYPQTAEADITPRPVELTWSDTALIYNGTEQSVTAIVKNAVEGDSFTLAYKGNTQTEVKENYKAEVTGLGNDNYTLKNATDISKNWSICYLEAPDAKIFGEEGKNGWYVSAVTLKPEEEYQISTDKETWSDSLEYEEQGKQKVTYYLREIKTGYITDAKTASFQIDTIAPTGEITIGTNIFKEFLNKVTFGHWFKNIVSVNITGKDLTSGIDTVEYQIVGKDETYDANGNWEEGKSFSIMHKDKYVIYARLTDKAGKQTIINSDGIVVFTDSTAVEAISYTKATKEPVDADVELNGNTVASVKNGENALTEGTDYIVSEDKITFSGDYLDTLSAGTHTLTVSYNPQGSEDYIDGDKPVESQITVNISRQTASLEITNALDKEYNGLPSDVRYETNSDAEVKVEYKVNGKWQSEAPIHVGSYEVKVSVPENGDYTAASVSKTFTISKADARVSSMTSGVSTYGDTIDISAGVNLLNGETYTGKIIYSYRLAGTDDEYTVGIPTKAGSYETKATVEAFGDYNGDSAEGSWTIRKKEVTVSGITAQDKVYDGKAAAELDCSQAAFVGILADDALTVSAKGTFADSNVASEKSVMIIDLTLGGEDAGNYVLSGAGQQTITTAAINPKEVSVVITPNGGTYEGTITAATAVLNGAVAGENPEVVLTYTGTANDGTTVSGTEVPAHAGTYTVTATVPNTNYSLKAEGAMAEFTVAKAEPQLSVSAVADKSYGEEAFKLETSNKGDGLKSFASDNEDIAKVSADGIVTIGNVGTAKITVSMDESCNYLAVAKEVTVTVVPKKVTVTPDKVSKVYGDKDGELTYKADGLVGEDTLTDIALSRAEGENAGDYTITASQKDGANPNYEVTFNEGTFVIEAKDIAGAKVTLGEALKYTGKEQTQEVTKVMVDGMEVPADSYEVTGNKATQTGVHTLTITAKKGSNFAGTATWTYVIAPTKTEQIKENTDGKVEIGNGTLTIEVKSEGNVPKTSLLTGKAEMIDMLVKSGDITADELAQIANGASIDIVLVVKDASATVSNEAKSVMTDTASKAGYSIGQYIDISLYKYMTVNDVTDGGEQLHSTVNKVKISMQIPKNLLNKDSKVNRTYYIVRYHDGKAESIEGTYNEKTQIFTFETDKFSDYAIACKDVKKADVTGNKTGINNKTGTNNKTEINNAVKTNESVKTGDTTNILGYVIALVGALAVILRLFASKRKRTNK